MRAAEASLGMTKYPAYMNQLMTQNALQRRAPHVLERGRTNVNAKGAK